jgi:hypothetical protein
MNNFRELFSKIGNSRKLLLLDLEFQIRFYYGFDENGKLCLAVKSKTEPPTISSTKLILFQLRHEENPENYWLYISLQDNSVKNVFYSFCTDICECIQDNDSEEAALKTLELRIGCWKKMLTKLYKPLNRETIQGLYGELLFIEKYLTSKIGLERAIKSWTGPLGTNKDFAFDDKWYEIKTISNNSNVIKISSINQLTSDVPGKLVVIKVEESSEIMGSTRGDVISLYKTILDRLTELNNPSIVDEYFDKLSKVGFTPDEDYGLLKFFDYDAIYYVIDDKFPRLTESQINCPAIGKVTYELIINSLSEFKGDF